jgi:hypothetical protein
MELFFLADFLPEADFFEADPLEAVFFEAAFFRGADFLAALFLDAPFLEADFLEADFLEAAFLGAAFFAAFLPALFFLGTLAPFSRASESPMAMACSRLFTLPPLPPGPERRVPFFFLCMALSTDLEAPFEYLGICFYLGY